jgi:hypothetical protein
MKNKESLHQRYLRDPLPVRLGGLAATLGRISSSARESNSADTVIDLLDEARHLIEWTAADADLDTAAELVDMQRLITLWYKTLPSGFNEKTLRTLLSVQAKNWSDKVLASSGLL